MEPQLDLSRAMITCNFCKAVVEKGWTSCAECGAGEASFEVSCCNCGMKQIAPSANFCPQCGQELYPVNHEPKVNELPNPYDLMVGLDEKAMSVVVKFFALAGQIGHVAGGYFFEQQASPILRGFGKVHVFANSDGRVVATYDSVLQMVMAQPIPGVDEECHWDTDSTTETYDQVTRVYLAIRENLALRGKEASDEYALVASWMGGEDSRMGDEEIRSMLMPIFPSMRAS